MTQSIGQKLKQARADQSLSLEKASEATRIRAQYLQALEADDLSVMPSPAQARGFLRNYAEYLGLDIDRLLDELRAEQKPVDEIIGPADESPPAPTPTPEPLLPLDATLLPPPQPDSTPPTDSPPEPAPAKPKRRGRKQVEPEPVIESQPEINAETIVQNEPEPIVEVIVEPQPGQQEDAPQPNVADNLWQTWLNRLSSIVPSSAKTLKPGAAPPEETSEAAVSESEASDPALDNLESAQIFREIGSTLFKRRELLSLHLEEVERNTHVKAHYLEALEKGAMDDLPSTVQTRGMLSNYASFLDLDVDALLLRYADALQARHREKNPQKPVRKPGQPIVANIPPLRNFIAGDMIFGVGMAVLLIGFSIWGVNRVMMIQSQQEIRPTGPSISDILLATPDTSLYTPTATLLPADAFVEATQTVVIPTQNLNVNVQVNLIAVERTFMRVVADGEEVFNGRTMPGTAYLFEAEEQVEVLAGSGAAIRIVYNGRDLGLMGGLGQVVNNIYLADEIITPTAQPSPTPTRTPAVTSTLPPTLTPAPSNTPVP